MYCEMETTLPQQQFLRFLLIGTEKQFDLPIQKVRENNIYHLREVGIAQRRSAVKEKKLKIKVFFTSNNSTFLHIQDILHFASFFLFVHLKFHKIQLKHNLAKFIAHLVAMKPICWVAQGDVKFGLGVHQNLQTVKIHEIFVKYLAVTKTYKQSRFVKYL